MSVVFADLVEFTSRSEQLDVEDVEGFLARYTSLLHRVLERHGGTVEKFIGDAVVAVFGAPTAHEDDAERAVRGALAIQDGVGATRVDGSDMHVRIGVTTGEALVTLRTHPESPGRVAAGDVVNTAARLQSAAPADAVLVDEPTYRATRRVVRYAEMDPVVMKGKSAPVSAWRALETRSRLPERPDAPDLPLVGRAGELASLVGALERSRREPSTQLVTLVGAPGIGKTRLVEELSAYADELPGLIRWRQGRSLPYGDGVAFWAVGEMVKAELGISESDSAGSAASKLTEVLADTVGDEHDREQIGRFLRPLVGLEAAATPTAKGGGRRGLAACRRFFEALAAARPTVLVFEDVHWADDALLDFIDLLADGAGAIPLLILCTARPELLERRPSWGGGKINTQTIRIPPLPDEDTARLIAEMLEEARLPADAVQELLVRAEGNPFYAREYVRMLLDQDILARENGVWRMTGAPDRPPESVRSVIAARLDTLTDAERGFVHDAAVLGRTGWIGAVCAISGMSSRRAASLLHGLEQTQFMRPIRQSTIAGEVEFTFAHALIQEVAYGQIQRLERAEKHERVAAWIEQLAGTRHDKAELLAYHYAAALHLRREASADVQELLPKARLALAGAGRQAEAVNSFDLAARHTRAALELTAGDDPARPALLHRYARALGFAGSATEEVYRTALDAQVAIENWEAAAEVCLWWSWWLGMYKGEGDRSNALGVRGLEYSERIDYTPVASRLAHDLSLDMVAAGRYADAVTYTEALIRRAEEADDAVGRALMLSSHGSALVYLGDPRGVDEMRAAATTLAEHADEETVIAYHNLGEALVVMENLATACDARKRALGWAERFADQSMIAGEQTALAESAYHAGDWDAALEMCTALVSHPAVTVAQAAALVRGRVMLSRGDAKNTLQDARRAIDFGTRDNHAEVVLAGLGLAALAYSAMGDHAGAGEALDRFYQKWSRVGGMPGVAPVLADIATITHPPERLDAAAAMLPPASPWNPALKAVAEHRYADAADTYAQIGSEPLEARANMMAGNDLANRGHTRRARDRARRAADFYRRVGATIDLRHAETLMHPLKPT